MSTAETRRVAATYRDSESSYQRFLDILEDATPTLKYRRPTPTSGIVRVVPIDSRGPSPSSHEAKRIIRKMIREMEPPRAPAEAQRPVRFAKPNVFLMAPQKSDPPAPWLRAHPVYAAAPSAAAAPLPALRPVRARSMTMPLLTFAMALGITVGLWHDAPTRRRVGADIVQTSLKVASFVLELATR